MQIHTDESDDMTFLVGFYFWFITFTTIGYGDYVPGHIKNSASSQSSGRPKNAALRTANIGFHLTWTTLGLCVVSSVLNAVAAFIEKRSATRLRAKCCSGLYGHQEGSEEMDTSKENDSCRVSNCNGSGNIQDENYHSITYV